LADCRLLRGVGYLTVLGETLLAQAGLDQQTVGGDFFGFIIAGPRRRVDS
jgi:hypothetical protein